jgi:DNA-directed RNA polymerase sigma subunit (sigma70/sigma32)
MRPEPGRSGSGGRRDGRRDLSPNDANPDDERALRSLEALAAEVRGVRPLLAGEQADLLAHAADRDPVARGRLAETHLAMVMRLARDRAGRGLPIGDLFQEGSVGLMAAILRFGSSGETDFDRYAERLVVEAMEAALVGESAAVEQEQLLVKAATDYDRVELKLARELRRKPTPVEIGKALEWSPERTEYVGELVDEARRRFDDEILRYLEPDDLNPGEDPGEEPEPGRGG